MFFGGGFPFGFGNPHGEPQEDEDNEEQETLYSILQVAEDATLPQIQQKHKELVAKYSSGDDADQEMLQQINDAYYVLSNPQQRKMYDRQMSQQKQVMEMMKAQRGQQGGKKQKPKMQPMKKALDVTLEQLCKGQTVNYFQERARTCEKCEGKGGINVTVCPECRGEGAVTKMAQVGPGMYTQVEQNCDHCKGMGDIFGQGGKCETCQGRKIVKKGTDLKITIPPGAPAGHVITIEGQGNELHDMMAGDLILVLRENPHDVFTRKGSDLFIKKNISLIEALLGFNFTIAHLDGHEYTFYTHPGDIVGDGHKKVIKGLGMPFFDEPESRGNLIVEFKVVMPKRGELTAEQLKALSGALPGKINERPKGTNYQLLQDFDREAANTNEQGGHKQEDQAEEEEGGIGCQGQ